MTHLRSKNLSVIIFALCVLGTGAFTLAAEKKTKKKKIPEVVANVVEARADHLVVITTKGKVVTKNLILNEQSKIIYVGFDGAKKEIAPKFTLRAKMDDDVITSVYVTPAVGAGTVDPTPEMLKMTPTPFSPS